MKRHSFLRLVLLGLALTLIVVAVWLAGGEGRAPRFALAAAEATQLDWWTVDGGGGSSSGGSYTLAGTVGQHDAGPAGGMSGGAYVLHGGFWPGAPPTAHELYLPMIRR
jgi:hypothetical protein